MSALKKIDAHPTAPDTSRAGNGAVVTFLGKGLAPAYLEDAEPSPLMEAASRWWQRLILSLKLAFIAVLIGGYPLATLMSHDINSAPVDLTASENWTAPEANAALNLIGREATGPGWAKDRSWWHPQARLTALPAWQDGVTGALSQYMMLAAANVTPASMAPDGDLMAAGRLLAPTEDSDVGPRIRAAAEALQRYDGRLSRGLAAAPAGKASAEQELDLFIAWANTAQADLRAAGASQDGWPASRADIVAVYEARAKAHVAAELLNATLIAEPALIASRAASEAKDEALMAWRRAANFNPLLVSSTGGTQGLLGDHPATLAWYISEAEAATITLKSLLSDPAPRQQSVPVTAVP